MTSDEDHIFPGENWFFYWKISSSLWKTRMSEIPGSKLFVPINWSFHSENGEMFDFSHQKPETDLKRLEECAQGAGKELIFLMPTGPAPYLPNAGLPYLLARNLSVDRDGLCYGILNADNKIHKVYSYFDQRVYKAYRRFCTYLGTYFSQNQMTSKIWGIECGYLDAQGFVSFLEDRSPVFQEGFAQFKQLPENLEKNNLEEQVWDFTKNMRELYTTTASHALQNSWQGVVRTAFLGTSNRDFLERITNDGRVSKFARDTLTMICNHIYPSSALLSMRTKKGVLGKILDDLVNNTLVHAEFSEKKYEASLDAHYRVLNFFEVYEALEEYGQYESWNDIGLINFLSEKYPWLYKVCDSRVAQLNFQSQVEEERTKITFVHGHELDKSSFLSLLKLFMSGGQIIIDSCNMDVALKQKLEAFILENSLNREKVNLHIQVESVTLGEGKMILFEAPKLARLSLEKKNNFWEKILINFNFQHLLLPRTEGIEFFWRTKSASGLDLRFTEIRRLGIYNTSSYKKVIKMEFPTQFALMKLLDQTNVKYQTFPQGIEIELMPEGSISLDFGHYQ